MSLQPAPSLLRITQCMTSGLPHPTSIPLMFQKPYACQIPGCSKRYTDPSSLRKHVKAHSAKEQQVRKKVRQSPFQAQPPQASRHLSSNKPGLRTPCMHSPFCTPKDAAVHHP